MTGDAATQERTPIPLAVQAEAAHEELKRRHRTYPMLVKNGKMWQGEADQGIAVMRAIRDTLLHFAEFEAFVRDAVRDAKRLKASLSEAATDPAVETVIEEFPGATLTDIRDTALHEEPAA